MSIVLTARVRAALFAFSVISIAFFVYMPQGFAHAAGNLILNPSFELGTPNNPTNWSKDSSGVNNATFKSDNTTPGRIGTSTRSAQVTITTYTSGDAKWLPDPTPTSAGMFYQFSDWYKSSTTTQIGYFANDGFHWLKDLPPAAAWTQVQTDILIPSGVTSLRVAHILFSAGTLDTDDYSLLEQAIPLFSQGIVTLTFDDGWKSIFTNAIPYLNTKGLKSTQLIYTDFINVGSDAMTSIDLLAMFSAGHEIGDHTKGHTDLASSTAPLTAAQLQTEIHDSRITLAGWLGTSTNAIKTFAYPYGSYNDSVKAALATEGYIGARSVDDGFNFTNSDHYILKIKHVTNLTTTAEIQGWINQAQADKTWLILMFHEIVNNYPADCQGADEGNGATECTTTALLHTVADYLSSNLVCVQTLTQVLTGAPCVVVDISAPTIATHADVIAEATSSAGANVTYTLPAVTDNVDSGILATCTPAAGSLFAMGSTTVTCSAHDAANNQATPTTFTVGVIDSTGPVITLSGSASMNIALNSVFSDPGASAIDAVDGSVAMTPSGTVNTALVGTYVITYGAQDAHGNHSQAIRTVHVLDTQAPVINLNGTATTNVAVGVAYSDAGATVTDDVDQNLTINVFIDGGATTTIAGISINTSVPGSHTIVFSATDSSNNTGSVTRTVVVSDLVLSLQLLASVTTESITITWTTSHGATSRVLWDTVSHSDASTTEASTTPNYGYANSTIEDTTLVTSHSVTISGLSPGTTYYMRPVSHGSPEMLGTEVSATTGTTPPPGSSGGGSSGGGGGGGGGGGIISGPFSIGYVNINPTGGSAAGGQVLGASTQVLTEMQIGAILDLLRSYGADDATIVSINRALRGTSTMPFAHTLTVGSRGDEVTALQNRLTADGFYNGPKTGYFGLLTKAAVQKFQTAHALPSTGLVGVMTRAVLNGS
jgi:peptidoglycan/xylan/chitin deacetylase (PgdA/CDA1 family)